MHELLRQKFGGLDVEGETTLESVYTYCEAVRLNLLQYRSSPCSTYKVLQYKFALYMFRNGRSGDCFLVTADDGARNILVDGNHKTHFSSVAWPVLGRIKKFDLAIATHCDVDHIGGIELLMNIFLKESTSCGLIAGVNRVEALQQPAILLWKVGDPKRIATNITCGAQPTTFDIGNICVQVISPTTEYYDQIGKSTVKDDVNNGSIVSVISYDGSAKVLLPGDCHRDRVLASLDESGFLETRFEAVVLPHHGSERSNRTGGRTGGHASWFHRVVKSKRCIVNGNSSSNGHPNEDLRQDLDNFIADTDQVVYLAHDFRKYFPRCTAMANKIFVCGESGYVAIDL